MARKFLQMGFNRSRRYENCKGGRKYDTETKALLNKGTRDKKKAESAEIFFKRWKEAEANEQYSIQKRAWEAKYG